MKYSDIPLAQQVVRACKNWNIQHIVISPGSRNAPLIISFTNDSFFKCYSIVDERSAGFFALGLAQQNRMPVALVCTSGSALLNYYPAISEAYYSNIPLLVLSADRPPYKIDVGDGQTIRQDGVYDRHIGRSKNLLLDLSHSSERIKRYNYGHNLTQEKIQANNQIAIDGTIEYAIGHQLPCHLNIPFEEPLYGEVKMIDQSTKTVKYEPKKISHPELILSASEKETWFNAEKIMVIVGVHQPEEELQQLMNVLGDNKKVLVFTETTSNWHHQNFISSIDSILFPIEKSVDSEALFHKLQPDLLLTFGGLIVSKKIKAFLRNYPPKKHWHIHPYRAFDTFFCLTKHFKIASFKFLEILNEYVPEPAIDGYSHYWQQKKAVFEEKRKQYLEHIPFSDFKAFSIFSDLIPQFYNVHLSNSSTVRYSQLFAVNPTHKVFCNRGTSGIDGSSSTAIGFAHLSPLPTLLITGDLSFFYDINAFWNNYVRRDFRVLLINNGGGGIFRILPGYKDNHNFNTYLETKQKQNAKSIAEHYGFDYNSAKNESELTQSLRHFFDQSDRPKLLEIVTPSNLNDKILLKYFEFIT